MKMHSTWLVHVSPVPSESGSRPGLQARWAHPCRTLRHAYSAMVARRRNRRAAFEIYALEDHLLRDIGLSRHEVTEAILLGRLPVRLNAEAGGWTPERGTARLHHG